MCAIIAWIGRMNNSALRGLFKEAEPWGRHSVGLAHVDGSGNAHVFKRAITPEKFLRNHNKRTAEAARHLIGFGHVRFATHGDIIDKNAHPFTHNEIIFAHNGVISNYRELARESGLDKIVVDSECLGPLIEKKELGRSCGSTGVVWISGGKLFIYRHFQDLNAFECVLNNETESTIIVASRTQIVERCENLGLLRIVRKIPVEERKAYLVTTSGLECTWECPQSEQVSWTRPARGLACGMDQDFDRVPVSKIRKYDDYDDEADEDDDDEDDENDENDENDALEDAQKSAMAIGQDYAQIILVNANGEVSVFANDADQVFEAIYEFVSLDAENASLVGVKKIEKGRYDSSCLARWSSSSTVEYYDKNVNNMAEFVLSAV